MDDPLASPYRIIDLANWPRLSVFSFFKDFSEPYHGVTIRLDGTATYRYAKNSGLSVYLSIVHRALAAAQCVENLRTRIVGDEVRLYDVIHGSSAVGRPDGTIGFVYHHYFPTLKQFVTETAPEVERVKQRTDLDRRPGPNVIRFSSLPWLDFTSLSHARHFAIRDSAPFVTFGKITESGGHRTLPVSIHLHHALADGLHTGLFAERFQAMLDEPEQASG